MDIVSHYESVKSEFFVDKDGKVLIGQRGLSALCGLSPSGVATTVKRAITKKGVKWLQPLHDKGLIRSNEDGKLPEEVAIAFIEHYADAGREAAKLTRSLMLKTGWRKFGHTVTGWHPTKTLSVYDAHILENPDRWQKYFADSFFDAYTTMTGNKRNSGVCGRFVADYVYRHLDPNLYNRLDELNPDRTEKLHQYMDKEIKELLLRPWIGEVTGLMRGCQSMKDFYNKYKMFYPKQFIRRVENKRSGAKLSVVNS